jgi:hypothetical protein
MAAGLSAMSCGSRDEERNPAAPSVPSAGTSSAEPDAGAGAQAVRTARQTWFFIDGCDDARRIRWKLFDAADNFDTKFPTVGAWTIQSNGTSTRTITCKQGDRICFGAIVDLPLRYFPAQWGVGIDGQFGPRKGACFACNNNTIGGKLVCRFRKSALAAGSDASVEAIIEEFE